MANGSGPGAALMAGPRFPLCQMSCFNGLTRVSVFSAKITVLKGIAISGILISIVSCFKGSGVR